MGNAIWGIEDCSEQLLGIEDDVMPSCCLLTTSDVFMQPPTELNAAALGFLDEIRHYFGHSSRIATQLEPEQIRQHEANAHNPYGPIYNVAHRRHLLRQLIKQTKAKVKKIFFF